MVEIDSTIHTRSSLDNVVIRQLRKEDLPALEWDGEYRHFRNLYHDAYLKMMKGITVLWVAEHPQDGIIGQVFLQLNCDRPELADGWQRAYLFSFRIKPEYRNQGLGTRILHVLENFLLDLRYTRMTLNVSRENTDAMRLYKRCGFKIVGEEAGIWSYIDDRGVWQTVKEPSWRMEKLLSRNPSGD